MRWIGGGLAAMVAVGLAAYALRAEDANEAGGPQIGRPAPALVLKDADGKSVDLKALKGKVVFLDFWATWCPPCRAALPHTQEISSRDAAKDGTLAVLAVNCREEVAEVKEFMKDKSYTFPVVFDADGKVGSENYKVSGIPTFVVVGKDGAVTWVGVGYDEDTGKAIDQAITDALAK